jgi:hypothetical protein
MTGRPGHAIVLALIVSGGCAKAPPSSPVSSRQGSSTYRVLAEAEITAGPAASPETVTAILPFAENGPPSYPDGALRSGCQDGLVPVRIHVGIDGRVSDVRRIPGRSVMEDSCQRAFEDSVGRAVATWRFIPAYQLRAVPSAVPGGEPAVERVPLSLDVDYEFLFSVVEGRGTVRARQARARPGWRGAPGTAFDATRFSRQELSQQAPPATAESLREISAKPGPQYAREPRPVQAAARHPYRRQCACVRRGAGGTESDTPRPRAVAPSAPGPWGRNRVRSWSDAGSRIQDSRSDPSRHLS